MQRRLLNVFSTFNLLPLSRESKYQKAISSLDKHMFKIYNKYTGATSPGIVPIPLSLTSGGYLSTGQCIE